MADEFNNNIATTEEDDVIEVFSILEPIVVELTEVCRNMIVAYKTCTKPNLYYVY
jgi:hypothetical protein